MSQNMQGLPFSRGTSNAAKTITMKRVDLLKLYQAEGKTFAVAAAGFLIASAAIYFLKVPYVGKTTIVVHDSQNSSLQAFSSQYFGMTKSVQESKKGNSVLSKYVEYLKTKEFFDVLVTEINSRGKSSAISLEEAQGYKELVKALEDGEASIVKNDIGNLQKLARWIQFKVDSDFELKAQVNSPSKNMSLFLVNTASSAAISLLEKKESLEMEKMEKFLSSQQEETDKNIQRISSQVAAIQNKDGGLVPVMGREKLDNYMAELFIRENELRLKISENEKIISSLASKADMGRTSQLYGTGGKIEGFKVENSIARARLGEIQNKIKQLRSQTKEMPMATLQLEDAKRKLDLEFSKYKELGDVVAKLQARKVSVNAKFDLIEAARPDTTGPRVSLALISVMALLLSQALAGVLVFLKLSKYAVASSARDVDAYTDDGHPQDPRVRIENSKIKFSLKDLNVEEAPAMIPSGSGATSEGRSQ